MKATRIYLCMSYVGIPDIQRWISFCFFGLNPAAHQWLTPRSSFPRFFSPSVGSDFPTWFRCSKWGPRALSSCHPGSHCKATTFRVVFRPQENSETNSPPTPIVSRIRHFPPSSSALCALSLSPQKCRPASAAVGLQFWASPEVFRPASS